MSLCNVATNSSTAMRGTRRELPILTERISPEPISSYTLVRPTPISSATSSGPQQQSVRHFPSFHPLVRSGRIDRTLGAHLLLRHRPTEVTHIGRAARICGSPNENDDAFVVSQVHPMRRRLDSRAGCGRRGLGSSTGPRRRRLSAPSLPHLATHPNKRTAAHR